jgi:hypothetical protein
MRQISIQSQFGLWRRSWFVLLAGSLASAAGADLFFYRHNLGWTAGAYLLLLTFLIALRSWLPHIRLKVSLLLLAVLGLAIALVQSPTRFNIACAILALGTLALSLRLPQPARLTEWIFRWWHLLFAPLSRPLHDGSRMVRWFVRHPNAATGPLRTVGLWTIPICLGGFFAMLFSIANPIVDHWTTVAYDWTVRWIDQLLEPERGALWIVAASITYGLLRITRHRRNRPSRSASAAPLLPAIPAWLPERAIVIRCLLLFNLVFGVETVLDALYLWGGRKLPAGFTAVQYAHRGAYPLIATALLAGVFVLVTFRQQSDTKESRLARFLVYAWIAQNIQLTFSAAWRLWLLVDSSLLTRLRLATSIWLLLVAAGLATLIWRIVSRRDNAWLIRVNLAMAAAVLYVCCFVNYDGFIASWNVDHCAFLRHDPVPSDLAYFATLGEESLPALHRLVPKLDTTDSRCAANQLIGELSWQLAGEMTDWQGWTIRRAHLRAQFPPPEGPVPPFLSQPSRSDNSDWAARSPNNKWTRYGD